MSKSKEEALLEMLESCNPGEDQKLEVYSKVYADQFKMFEDSNRAKIKGLTDRDYFILGETLSRQSLIQLQEGNNLNNLGTLPTIALDVITAVQGNSVIPYFASEQVIDEVQGMVYFEDVYATTSRGNIQAGDILSQAAGVPDKYARSFAGETQYDEVIGTTDTTSTQFADLEFEYKPVRAQYVSIKVGDLVATDDGHGNLIGNGIWGSVDYANGKATINLGAATAAATDIVATYNTDFEAGTLPSINTKLNNKLIKATSYALQTDTSIINSYVMQKRHGIDMKLRAINLLQENILNEVTNDLVHKVVGAVDLTSAASFTQFNMTLPTGVSQQAHYNSVGYVFDVISNKMANRSGRGKLAAVLASPKVCAFLAQLNGFKVIGEISAFASVYGVLNGQTVVIRCPQLDKDVRTQDKAYFIYKGETAFDAAAVYAPFMPLVSTNDIPVSDNLLQRRSAVATMAASDVVVPAYIQAFGLANNPY